jgi:protocatechuate 3,4-dioxygenase alpha subunit
MTAGPTPSQTVGPFFRLGLGWLAPRDAVAADSPGAVVISGQVLDGAGDPVPDAVVEIFQPGPGGFGRALTDAEGGYRFVTVKVDRGGVQAPHLDISVFARGLLQRGWTRCYFPDESSTNSSDPVLQLLARDEPGRAATLVAVPAQGRLRFDIRLQGDGETVFFDW